jgi:hypothetical protein
MIVGGKSNKNQYYFEQGRRIINEKVHLSPKTPYK